MSEMERRYLIRGLEYAIKWNDSFIDAHCDFNGKIRSNFISICKIHIDENKRFKQYLKKLRGF